MYTHKIKLQQISREYFAELHSYWYESPKSYLDWVCARIVNPLIYEDYNSLIEDFLKHPNAFEISVNKNGLLRNLRKRDITRENLSDLVSPTNPDKLIEGIIVTRLRRGSHSRGNPIASIKFTELGRAITSFEVKSSARFATDFTLEGISQESHFIGLLDPKREF